MTKFMRSQRNPLTKLVCIPRDSTTNIRRTDKAIKSCLWKTDHKAVNIPYSSCSKSTIFGFKQESVGLMVGNHSLCLPRNLCKQLFLPSAMATILSRAVLSAYASTSKVTAILATPPVTPCRVAGRIVFAPFEQS